MFCITITGICIGRNARRYHRNERMSPCIDMRRDVLVGGCVCWQWHDSARKFDWVRLQEERLADFLKQLRDCNALVDSFGALPHGNQLVVHI